MDKTCRQSDLSKFKRRPQDIPVPLLMIPCLIQIIDFQMVANLLFLAFFLIIPIAGEPTCSSCKIELIEDIPLGLPTKFYPTKRLNTSYDAYVELFANAQEEILLLTASSSLRGLEATDQYQFHFGYVGIKIDKI